MAAKFKAYSRRLITPRYTCPEIAKDSTVCEIGISLADMSFDKIEG
ncbi:MAG: hypothetical protein JSW53_00500 [Candidatus Bathyarchaeota archaeon]|nr:MAG: hypothetical protein JSW53_00500 [Candidatus Bathyarchaeota archaeon]